MQNIYALFRQKISNLLLSIITILAQNKKASKESFSDRVDGGLQFFYILKSIFSLGVLAIFLVFVLLGLAACFGSAKEKYDCFVIDPTPIYGYNGPINSEINRGIRDIQDLDNYFDIAASSFDRAASLADSDDDRDLIAKNDLGCVLLKQLSLSSSASHFVPVAQQFRAPLGLAFIQYPLISSFFLSTNGDCPRTLQETSILFSQRSSNLPNADEQIILDKNSSILDDIKCSSLSDIEIMIKIIRLASPEVRLNIFAPSGVFDDIEYLEPIIGGKSQGMISSIKREVILRLPSEGVYCYKLKATAAYSINSFNGYGTVFVEVGSNPTRRFIKDYYVIVNKQANKRNVQLSDGDKAFVLESILSNPTGSYGKTIRVFFNKVPTRSFTLSAGDKQDVERVRLAADSKTLSYEVEINGIIINQGEIKNIADDDIFLLTVYQNSAYLQRQTCSTEGKRLGLGPAVDMLEYDMKKNLKDKAIEDITSALMLMDPLPPGISANTWNKLCRWGSLSGHAIQVVDSACKMAVDGVDELNDPELYTRARDSRGLARALTNNNEGAQEDFNYYVQHSSNPDRVNKRITWITRLREGGPNLQEVFDISNEAILKMLIAQYTEEGQ